MILVEQSMDAPAVTPPPTAPRLPARLRSQHCSHVKTLLIQKRCTRAPLRAHTSPSPYGGVTARRHWRPSGRKWGETCRRAQSGRSNVGRMRRSLLGQEIQEDKEQERVLLYLA